MTDQKPTDAEPIPENVMRVFDEVYGYASHVDEWMAIKKQIVSHIPAKQRSLFCRRHAVTKLQSTNAFEMRLIRIWEGRTGRPVVLPPQHDDAYLERPSKRPRHI